MKWKEQNVYITSNNVSEVGGCEAVVMGNVKGM